MGTQHPPALAALKARAKGTTQTALAELIGASQPQVSDWLAGKGRPDATNRERIAALFEEIPTSSWLLRCERPSAPRKTANGPPRAQAGRAISSIRSASQVGQVAT